MNNAFPSILLLTIRRIRKLAVDVRFQGDDEANFHKIVDKLPGNWHYRTQPVLAYKTIKPLGSEDILKALVAYVRDEIMPLALAEGMVVRAVFEEPDPTNKQQDAIRQELYDIFIHP